MESDTLAEYVSFETAGGGKRRKKLETVCGECGAPCGELKFYCSDECERAMAPLHELECASYVSLRGPGIEKAVPHDSNTKQSLS